jgi:predicted CXXCH cytochrome family protein
LFPFPRRSAARAERLTRLGSRSTFATLILDRLRPRTPTRMPPRKPRRPSASRPGTPAPTPSPPNQRRRSRRTLLIALGALTLLAVGAAAFLWLRQRSGTAAAPAPGAVDAPAARFVGSAACAGCHADAFEAWRGSQHDRAMQEAMPATVLGDFSGGSFVQDGTTTTFLRRDSLFLVRTEGADGEVGEFEVRYTFGVDPLQQYLIELEGGRVQPLTVAWDSRPRDQGGQRWMSLYPGERIEHGDELHWTGRQQNWNFMCADCHSTDVRKNYEPARDAFATLWSEIDVGCEACHGPGSRHLEWASAGAEGDPEAEDDGSLGLTARLDEREGVRWSVDPTTGLPRRSAARTTQREISVCAQCHSRRAQVAEGYVAGAPLLDHYLPSLLMPGLYHPDGQQRDEVYIHASFLQSRMFAAGVTCADCHDPHTQKLRAEGNAVCAQCHTPARYDAPAHHFHEQEGEGGQCVACHMPETTYMQIDPRRDHSLRVPRPDRSVSLGVPNACTQCHTDRDASWAAAAVRRWYGRDAGGFQTFAETFAAHERGEPGAPDSLAAIARDRNQPAIVRASALARLADRPTMVAMEAARVGLFDADPLARRAALGILEALPPADRVALAAPLLSDSSRIVRLQAAWMLAPSAGNLPLAASRAAFTRASNEFIASQRYLADRPENRVTLGTWFAQLGRVAEAETEYRAAIRLRRAEVAAYVNLADLLRGRGREAEAESLLREGLEAVPGDPSLHHALGLSLARSGRLDEAREMLRRAAELGQGEPRFAYAYAVALHSGGDVAAAIETLEAALEEHPNDYDLLFALAAFHRDAGRRSVAAEYAARLRAAHPYDGAAVQLHESLR